MLILYDVSTLIPVQIIDGCDANKIKLESEKYKAAVVGSIPDNLSSLKYDIATGTFVAK